MRVHRVIDLVILAMLGLLACSDAAQGVDALRAGRGTAALGELLLVLMDAAFALWYARRREADQ